MATGNTQSRKTMPAPGFGSNREVALTIGACLLVVVVTGLVLLAMGRPLICTCGTIKAWHGEVMSSENSQHISDWYSFTHIVHGFLFYFLLWALSRAVPPLRRVSIRMVLAVIIEAAWEVLENTDFIIERYREATIALDYYGDSVINSGADIAFMSLGFLLAWRLPVAASIAVAVGLEILLAIIIRDNLTLNILMLLWPVEAIRNWQGG